MRAWQKIGEAPSLNIDGIGEELVRPEVNSGSSKTVDFQQFEGMYRPNRARWRCSRRQDEQNRRFEKCRKLVGQ